TMHCPLDPLEVRNTACSDNHDFGRLGLHIGGFRIGIEMDLASEALELGLPPVDDAEQILAPARSCAEQNLSAESARGLEQHNGGPARRAYPAGLQGGWTRPQHSR